MESTPVDSSFVETEPVPFAGWVLLGAGGVRGHKPEGSELLRPSGEVIAIAVAQDAEAEPQERAAVHFAECDEAALARFCAGLGPGGIARVAGDERTVTGQGQTTRVIRAHEVDASSSAHALEQLRNEQEIPVTVEDPELGIFALDRTVGLWEGRAPWCDEPIDVLLGDPASDLPLLHRLLDQCDSLDGEARGLAGAELEELYNAEWREEEEPELTPEAIAARVSARSLHVDGESSVTLYLDDDELFGGHEIAVEIDPDTGPQSASI